jgi:uncharacterized membrane protein
VNQVDEVAEYVVEVRAALADLPPRAREELLEDLPAHLAEVAAEGDGPLRSRLGPPARYAAELRATVEIGPSGRSATAAWLATAATARVQLRAADVRLGKAIGYAKASDYLRLLVPAWWLLRGYLVAMAVAYALDIETMGLLPRVGGGMPTAYLMLAAFMVGSIWLGRHHARLRKWARYALAVTSVYLVVLAVVGFTNVDHDIAHPTYQVVENTQTDLAPFAIPPSPSPTG